MINFEVAIINNNSTHQALGKKKGKFGPPPGHPACPVTFSHGSPEKLGAPAGLILKYVR